jgi:hypothetical protein
MCEAFTKYGVCTAEQRKQINNIRRMASNAGIRDKFTLKKIKEVHKLHNWDWDAANEDLTKLLGTLDILLDRF